MILFQEQFDIRNHGTDSTLDPSYFANIFNHINGTSSGEVDELRAEVEQLKTTINELNNKIEEMENNPPEVHKVMTQAEYDALSEEEKAKDIEYFIDG